MENVFLYSEEADADGNKIDSPVNSGDDTDNEPGAWEEDFKLHHDSKPYGPEAVAMDFTFPQANVLFGKTNIQLSDAFERINTLELFKESHYILIHLL